ncbi:MAG: ribonuclease T2-like [Bathelium mastoideum]|nr:MAG: ribonuclease T2-like [Bathelium mastoideum]
MSGPDKCDGTYESYCDHQRIYKNITQILEDEGSRGDILSFMGEYWKDLRGHDESLYEHEWSKHGTCINTLEPKCYPNYRAQEEVVTYFEKTVELFKTLPSYTWLSDAGITPSHSKVYDLTAVQNALQKGFGHPVTVKCHRGELDETWYHFNVKGGFNTGKDGGIQNFVPSDPDGIKSTCPKHVKYIPKLSRNL